MYANVIGFPGGVAWAMMVARICQLYPNSTSSTIVAKFFKILVGWRWPEPILLKQIEDGPLNVRIWNPKLYHGDRNHLMPVITPAYPSMCATHNISQSTKTIVEREMARASKIVDQIFIGKGQGENNWSKLFQKHTFFTKGYKYYLSVVAASRTKDAQLKWAGAVEAKLRHLVMKLEMLECIALAHPFNKGFDRLHICKTEEDREKVASGDFNAGISKGKAEEVGLGRAGVLDDENAQSNDSKAQQDSDVDANGSSDSDYEVHTTTFYIGLELNLGQFISRITSKIFVDH